MVYDKEIIMETAIARTVCNGLMIDCMYWEEGEKKEKYKFIILTLGKLKLNQFRICPQMLLSCGQPPFVQTSRVGRSRGYLQVGPDGL